MTVILFILALPTVLSLIAVGISFVTNDSVSQRKWWRLQVLIAYDQLVNSLFMGWADETISSRSWRGFDWRKNLIDRVFFWEPDHCKKSYDSEKVRNQLPPEMRGD